MTIVGKWGVDKTKTAPGDLSYLSNIVDNTVAKICVINWLWKSMLFILKHQVVVD